MDKNNSFPIEWEPDVSTEVSAEDEEKGNLLADELFDLTELLFYVDARKVKDKIIPYLRVTNCPEDIKIFNYLEGKYNLNINGEDLGVFTDIEDLSQRINKFMEDKYGKRKAQEKIKMKKDVKKVTEAILKGKDVRKAISESGQGLRKDNEVFSPEEVEKSRSFN